MKKPKPTPDKSESITIPAEAIAKLPAEPISVDYIALFKTVIEKHSNDTKWTTGSLSGIKTLSNKEVHQIQHCYKLTGKFEEIDDNQQPESERII